MVIANLLFFLWWFVSAELGFLWGPAPKHHPKRAEGTKRYVQHILLKKAHLRKAHNCFKNAKQ